MRLLDTNNLKQLGLLSLILVVGLTIAGQLYTFFPGLLGAITLYVLLRQYFFVLTVKYRWRKWLTATVFMLGVIVVFVIPLAFLFNAILPKFNSLLGKTGQLNELIDALANKMQELNMPLKIDSEQVISMVKNVSSSIPSFLGATANVLTNTVLAFFLLYFMLVQGREMEATIKDYMPLQDNNTDEIWEATRNMVVSNAVGIPLLAASQALVALIGYWIFGVPSYVLLGVLTGVFSVVPIVGCAIVWVPICIYLFATGDISASIGLAIYSFVLTGGVDNVLRFTLLKQLGDVHPIVTTLGIIVGLPLFGFMGFIFGPLLISYFLLLIKIYRVEFTTRKKIDT